MKDRLFAANNLIGALVLLAGLLFRLASMRGSLWYDEAFSAWLVDLPFGQMQAATLADVHPPLYYGLLWLTVAALGRSEFVLRLPSLIAGVLLVPVAYRLASRLDFAPAARRGVVALVSLAPFMVYYSTEARSYALQMLAVAAASLGLVDRRYWLLIGGSLAALYLQHTAIFTVAALFAAAWWYLEKRQWLMAAGAVAAGYVPGLAVLLWQARAVGGGYWILPPTVGRVADVLDNLLWWMPYNPMPVTGLVTGLAVVLIVADGRRLWQQQRLALIAAAGPLFLAVLASIIWQPVLIARILAPAALFLYMLIADVTTRSRPRAMWWALAGVFALVINGAVVWGSAGRPADLYTISGYRPGDGIYHLNAGTYVPWHYYSAADQWLFLQENTLATNVSNGSKTAMGFQQAKLADVQCLHPRWWVITMDNPTSTPAELRYSASLKDKLPAVTPLRDDVLVNSKILLFEPKCTYSGL